MSDYLTEEEIANMVKAFNDMEIRPSASSPEEFKTWLEEYKDDDDALDAYIPRISTFTGDNTNAAKYDIWRYEVLCLVKNRFTHATIKMAIRKSLKGNAAVIPMKLGVELEATIDDIIDRMDSIFGSVFPVEALLGQFYTARQHEDDVASWGCRLEDILRKATDRGKVKQEDTNSMLTSKFFEGLRPDIKNIGRYKMDSVKEEGTNLGPKKETTPEKKTPIKPKQNTTIENKQIQQLTARNNQLTTEIQAMRQNSDESKKEQIRWRRRDTYQQPDETILHRPLYHYKRKTPRSETICWRCKQPGHYAIECTVRLDHSRKTVRALNLQQNFVMEHTINSDYDTKPDPRLIGSANEVTVTLNGLTTKALLDTGSTVSTISQEFYERNLQDTTLKPINNFLNIECADGQPLPYMGYVEADLQLTGSSRFKSYTGLFLVVPNSPYHKTVPLLIGTNILTTVMEDIKTAHGER
ncbi:Hypothetical predicted protein [Mytilus galloprovincialis]|uniref:CCHC-type domain-containing protein n=1 Tax=Mytilus galloprovincialis TaxID=29158 RepID=A0A8B6ETH8_MYTGA|nr:Hypothetical predicted protein [Mytilus galloprovincialis]